MKFKNLEIQQEFDNEPTYIVEKSTDTELVCISEKIPPKLRREIAMIVRDKLLRPGTLA